MNRASKTRIRTLQLKIQPLAADFLKYATEALKEFKKPWNMYSVEITDAKRDIVWQAGIYSQGRKWLKSKRQWVIVDPKKIVTYTIEGSNHLAGRAFDVALWNQYRNRYIWPDPRSRDAVKAKRALKLWKRLADIGRELGFLPGADWPKPKTDYTHFEIHSTFRHSSNVYFSRR